jgi:hypothetical protein
MFTRLAKYRLFEPQRVMARWCKAVHSNDNLPGRRRPAGGLRSPPTSVSSPVAMRMTFTALPITSAGRFSPFGPRGIKLSSPFIFSVLKFASGDEEGHLILDVNRVVLLFGMFCVF